MTRRLERETTIMTDPALKIGLIEREILNTIDAAEAISEATAIILGEGA